MARMARSIRATHLDRGIIDALHGFGSQVRRLWRTFYTVLSRLARTMSDRMNLAGKVRAGRSLAAVVNWAAGGGRRW
jgi:hypothetical protein